MTDALETFFMCIATVIAAACVVFFLAYCWGML